MSQYHSRLLSVCVHLFKKEGICVCTCVYACICVAVRTRECLIR